MFVLLLLLLLALSLAAGSAPFVRQPHAKCNAHDHRIYKAKGHTFPVLFRSFGGLTVSKSAFEARIMRETALSAPCASCYGDSFICGYDRCFWSCRNAGTTCDACLHSKGCMAATEACTGFPQ